MKQRLSIVFLTAILASFVLHACKAPKTVEEANKSYQELSYAEAGDIYKKVYSKIKDKEQKKEAAYKAAESFRLSNQYKTAEQWYDRAYKAKYGAEALFKKAQMMKAQGKYKEAIAEFNNYQKEAPADERVAMEIKGCEYGIKWPNDTTRYVVENFKLVNSKDAEFAPAFGSKKHDVLYFTSDRPEGVSKDEYGWTGNGFTDLWVTEQKGTRKDKKFQSPTLVKGSINSKFNDGTIVFDSKYSTAYYTQCNGNDGKGKTCKIYQTTKRGEEWSEPQVLPFCSDSFNCGQPAISADGTKLYFSSDMPGGQGGHDLYVVNFVKRGKTWSDPVNLGTTINTSGDEVFPYIHDDGTLYFSSDGHVGVGELDLFYSTGVGEQWSTPVNMKTPMNSSYDDFAIIMEDDKEKGYFSSNRLNGRGDDDIYSFFMTPLIFNLSGVVTDCDNKAQLGGATVTITSSSDSGKIVVKTDKNGFYKVTLKAHTDYEIVASYPEKYYFESKPATQTTKGREFSADLVQDFCLVNQTTFVQVLPIYYDLDKANIREDASKVLDTLVMTLNKYPRITIELGSHTDCRNTAAYNQDLSQRRADSAVNYLIKHGIDSARIVAKGYGESKLMVPKCACEGPNEREDGRKCTEAEHQLNRRTEVKITGVDYEPKPKEDPTKKPAPGKPGQRPAPGRPGQPKPAPGK